MGKASQMVIGVNLLDDTEKLFQERIIGKKERNIVVSLLNNEYLSKKVLGQKSYSDQAVLLNQKIWPKLFAEDIRPRLPKLVYLEMEQVVSELLQRDLRNPESLFYHVLFNEDLRNRVMDNLFGVYGCWDTELLSHCLNPDLKGRTRDELLAQRGTCFFWAVDLKGRHTRLMLTQESGQTYLKGIDHNGMMHRVPLTPEGICHGLNAKGLLPSLYTSFLVVALARGIKCFGGFWQADYLPCMQQKTVDALAECGYEKWARKVISVPTENYVTGMTVALAEYEDKTIRPAGCAEIIAGGGLLESDMAKIREITVEDANFFGQMEIYRDFCREAGAKADLGDFYNKARSDLIAQKMVRIRL